MPEMQHTQKPAGLDPDVQAVTDLDSKLAKDPRFTVAVDQDGTRAYSGKVNGEDVQIKISADKANASLMVTGANGTYGTSGGPDTMFNASARDVVTEINKVIEQPQSLPAIPNVRDIQKELRGGKPDAPTTSNGGNGPLW